MDSLERLSQSLDAAAALIQGLRRENRSLNDRLAETLKKLAEKPAPDLVPQSQLRDAEEKIRSLEESLEILSSSSESQAADLDRLRERIAVQEDDQQKLERLFQDASSKNEEISIQNDILAQQISDLRGAAEQESDHLRQTELKNAEYLERTQILELELEQARLDSQIERKALESERGVLLGKLAELELMLLDAQDRITRADAKAREMALENAAHIESINVLRLELEQANADQRTQESLQKGEKAELVARLESLETTFRSVKNELEQAEEYAKLSAMDLDSLKASFNLEREDWKAALQSADQRILASADSQRESEAKCGRLELQLAALGEDLERSRLEILDLQDEKKGLLADLDEEKKQGAAAQAELELVKNARSLVETDLSALGMATRAAESRLRELEQEKKETEAWNAGLAMRVEELRAEADASGRRVSAAEQESAGLKSANSLLEERLRYLEEEIADGRLRSDASLRTAREDAVALNAKLSEAEGRILELEASLGSAVLNEEEAKELTRLRELQVVLEADRLDLRKRKKALGSVEREREMVKTRLNEIQGTLENLRLS